MTNYDELERVFLKKVIVSNIFPDLKDTDNLVLSKPSTGNGPNGFTTKITIATSAHGVIFFAAKDIYYDRFKLTDYRAKVTDTYLEVPLSRVTSPTELINYMNEIFLNSANIRVITEEYDIFRGFQILLKLENLQSFNLSNLQPNSTLVLRVKDGSYLFEGSLEIKFV